MESFTKRLIELFDRMDVALAVAVFLLVVFVVIGFGAKLLDKALKILKNG